jgi:hypothetical protein
MSLCVFGGRLPEELQQDLEGETGSGREPLAHPVNCNRKRQWLRIRQSTRLIGKTAP